MDPRKSIEISTASIVFFWLFFFLVFLSAAATYHRYVTLKDFEKSDSQDDVFMIDSAIE